MCDATSRTCRRFLGITVLSVLFLGVAGAGAQEEQEAGSPTVLGQPAGWSLEPEEAPALATIVEGTALYEAPDPDSPVLAMLPAGQLPMIESHPPWVQVRYGDQQGWVDLETPRKALDAVERSFQADSGGASLELPPGNWIQHAWGPYQLFSLVDDRKLLDFLAQAARGHAELYGERFGLRPQQAISGSVVMLDSPEIFQRFQRAHGVGKVGNGYFKSPEFVFLYPGKKSKRQLAALVLHELTHLLNWQVQRELDTTEAPLPIWLEEGMADDLALALMSRQGKLSATPLGPGNLHYGPQLGSLLVQLVEGLAGSGSGYVPSLRQLIEMDRATFLGVERERHYVLSSLWVRYFLDGAGDAVAQRFRGYLASMFRGGSPHPDELATQLGRDLDRFESGFRAWLTQHMALFGL
ncbi:MAG: SH3 domain-containing protein [Acidobacteriota bacterium]